MAVAASSLRAGRAGASACPSEAVAVIACVHLEIGTEVEPWSAGFGLAIANGSGKSGKRAPATHIR